MMDPRRLAIFHRMVRQQRHIVQWFADAETAGLPILSVDPEGRMWRLVADYELSLARETALAFRAVLTREKPDDQRR